MNAARAIAAVTLLLFGLFVNTNPTLVDDWLESNVDNSDNEENILVGIQPRENWLVLQVSFPSHEFDKQAALAQLSGSDSVESYISQVSAENSIVVTTLFGETWESVEPLRFWGADSSETRDSGLDGAGVGELVKQVVKSRLTDENLSQWDLNSDGIIDRLLILHSANPQEISGNSNSIWSHFSELDEPIKLGSWTIPHYTIASTESGMGTIAHEMIHQMGALDLYDVHSELPTRSWNGVGDWGLMASGNWNGNGASPALPIASTLGIIGANRSIIIDPYIGGEFELFPLSNGGQYLSIESSENEYFHISYRSVHGFDSSLPGSGILVEHQNRNNGDERNNLVNTDPKNAWVIIVEADGDDALIRNRDRGSSGDPFQSGDVFGGINYENGMSLRDYRGRLVNWVAEVNHITVDSAVITISPTQSVDSVKVIPPHSPIELLEGESAFVDVIAPFSCNLNYNISSFPGHNYFDSIIIPEGLNLIKIIEVNSSSPTAGKINGLIGCSNSDSTNFELDWYMVGNRIITTEVILKINSKQSSQIIVNLDYAGTGSRNYDITIDGPASRISSVLSQGEITSGEGIVIDIDPDGLLVPGMIAKGEIIFVDDFGIEQRVHIVFEAESSFDTNSILSWLSEPSNGILMITILLAFSIISGGKDKTNQKLQPNDETEY
jgi:M6 family metalloprotease-like protein